MVSGVGLGAFRSRHTVLQGRSHSCVALVVRWRASECSRNAAVLTPLATESTKKAWEPTGAGAFPGSAQHRFKTQALAQTAANVKKWSNDVGLCQCFFQIEGRMRMQ
jgi:hypothetical protein